MNAQKEKQKVRQKLFLNYFKELGQIPESVRNRILNAKSQETLTKWLQLAAKEDSFEEFLNNM
ncbi:MAG: hypothetical protein ACI4FW_05740 [Bariatricus sp.]